MPNRAPVPAAAPGLPIRALSRRKLIMGSAAVAASMAIPLPSVLAHELAPPTIEAACYTPRWIMHVLPMFEGEEHRTEVIYEDNHGGFWTPIGGPQQ